MTTQDEGITLRVDPGGKPKLALQYLRSYEHLGTAEVTIHSPYVWHCKQLGGQGSGKRATWRRSLGELAKGQGLYKVGPPFKVAKLVNITPTTWAYSIPSGKLTC